METIVSKKQSQSYESAINGSIEVAWQSDGWHVRIGETNETSPFLTRMWEIALGRIPKNTPMRNVLLLGLGAGGTIEKVHKRFPSCRITAVEHDPVMIEMANTLGLYAKEHTPRIICADAEKAVGGLSMKFDLILTDLFKGERISPHLMKREFIALLEKKLDRRGYLIVNAFKEKKVIENFYPVFSKNEVWKTNLNWFGVFRPFGNGMAGDPVPSGFIHPLQIHEYLTAQRVEGFPIEIIGRPGCIGARWRVGPIIFEEFTSDVEPESEPGPPHRVQIWQPISRTDIPHGWHRSWCMGPVTRQIGVAFVSSDYFSLWAKHAQRDRLQWSKNKKYRMQPIPQEQYIKSYPAKGRYARIRKEALPLIERRFKVFGEKCECFAACAKTGEIVGAVVLVPFPELKQCMYLSAYVDPAAQSDLVATGLIDFCFQECLKRDIRYLDFGSFWVRGNPNSWKGFSRFKQKFGAYLIRYPKPLFRVAKW